MGSVARFSLVLFLFVTTETLFAQSELDFLRADANDSGQVSIADANFIFNYLHHGGNAPPCKDAADANDDGKIDLSDVTFIYTYIVFGAPVPPAPGPTNCGPDPTSDNLDCQSSQCAS